MITWQYTAFYSMLQHSSHSKTYGDFLFLLQELMVVLNVISWSVIFFMLNQLKKFELPIAKHLLWVWYEYICGQFGLENITNRIYRGPYSPTDYIFNIYLCETVYMSSRMTKLQKPSPPLCVAGPCWWDFPVVNRPCTCLD